MKERLYYIGPSGARVADPGTDLIRTELDRPLAYWEQGSGDAGLQHGIEGPRGYSPARGRPSVAFFVAEPQGLFVTYWTGDSTVEWVPYNGEPALKTFEHHLGGEPMRRPRACLVPIETGHRVLMEFARTGLRSSDVSWVGLHELDFER